MSVKAGGDKTSSCNNPGIDSRKVWKCLAGRLPPRHTFILLADGGTCSRHRCVLVLVCDSAGVTGGEGQGRGGGGGIWRNLGLPALITPGTLGCQVAALGPCHRIPRHSGMPPPTHTNHHSHQPRSFIPGSVRSLYVCILICATHWPTLHCTGDWTGDE